MRVTVMGWFRAVAALLGGVTVSGGGRLPVCAGGLGDVNGDGHVDLAVANNSSDNVSVLLGNGDGTFNDSAFAVSSPDSVAVGDFNGDGHPDLAVTNGGVSVRLNTTTTPTPSPTSVVTPAPTPTPSPTPVVTPSPTPGATATTTTVSVIQAPLPLGLGGIVMIPTAHVAPANATGTVQFKDGSANLGAPVPAVAGIAVGPASTLRPGVHHLSAVFTPSNPTTFMTSTSNTVTVTFS